MSSSPQSYQLFDRPMPHSEELEKALLSCLLQDPRTTEDILGMEDHVFYIPSHRTVFTAIRNVASRDHDVDLVMVGQELCDMGLISQIGGIPGLRDIYSKVPTAVNYEEYAHKLIDYYQRRKMIEVCANALTDAYDPENDTTDILGDLEGKILAAGKNQSGKRPQRIGETVDKAIEKLRGIYTHDQEAIGKSTGLVRLDQIIGGLRKGEMIVIAARPSLGKTALAAGMLRHISLMGDPTMLVGHEMQNHQITQRLIYSQAGVTSDSLYQKTESWENIEARLLKAKGDFQRLPLILDDCCGSWEDVRHRIRVAVRKMGVKVVAIDYLQLMSLKNKNGNQNRENEVATMSRQIKQLALELDIPIVILAQLNRSAEGQVPSVKDLRESGAIEQDADVIILLYRERETDDQKVADLVRQGYPVPTSAKVGKNRNGKTGKAELEWYAQHVIYADRPRISDEDVPQ